MIGQFPRGQRMGIWRAAGRLASAAAVGCAIAFGLPHGAARASQPTIVDLPGSSVTIDVSEDRIRWGEEVDITVSVVNETGQTRAGGIFVSFDQEVIILSVEDGQILRAGSTLYDLKQNASRPIKRGTIQAWQKDWAAGRERKVRMTILPITGDSVRVLARATFLDDGKPPQLHIAPGRTESRSFDEASFPTMVGYVWVSRRTNLRRAIRRAEQRIGGLGEPEQRRFAQALAVALDDPKAFSDISSGPGFQGLRSFVPIIVDRLRKDPIEALGNLRCLMVNLECRRGAVYFGVPLAVYAELSAEQLAQREAKAELEKEKGGSELAALMEAAGISFRIDRAAGVVHVDVQGKVTTIKNSAPLVPTLLDEIVSASGVDAKKTYAEANGLSFVQLQSILKNPSAPKKQ